MDYSPSSSSVHGILQTGILEWVAIPFSRGSSLRRDQTQDSCVADRFFTVWTISKALQAIAKNHRILLRSYLIFGGSYGKESAHSAGDTGSIPGLERWPGEANVNPLRYYAWEVPWTEEPGGLWTGWQGGLACCSPWGRQELDTTWRLNKQIEIIRSMWN